MKRIKICMISPIFPPLFSGAALQAITLAKAIQKKGHKIVFLSLTDTKGLDRDSYESFDVYYAFAKKMDSLTRGTSYIQSFLVMAKLIKVLIKLRREYDIIHHHGIFFPSTIFGLFGRTIRKKTVYKASMLTELDYKRIGRFFGKLHIFFVSNITFFVATSNELLNEFKNSGIPESRFMLIPNGVDSKLFFPPSESRKKKLRQEYAFQGKIIVTFVGSIIYRKGIMDVVKFWPEIVARIPNSILLLIGAMSSKDGVIGDDFCYKEILSIIRNKRLGKNIIFTGRIEHVNKYLQASDIFVFPSKLEGMPNVLIEAMACNVPCVSYRVSGASDIIDHDRNGYLADLNDIQMFKRLLLSLLKDETKRKQFGYKAQATIKRKFFIDAVADRYIELYTRLIS